MDVGSAKTLPRCGNVGPPMSHLRAEQSTASLWRWACAECGAISFQMFLTESDAVASARKHSHDLHPEYH